MPSRLLGGTSSTLLNRSMPKTLCRDRAEAHTAGVSKELAEREECLGKLLDAARAEAASVAEAHEAEVANLQQALELRVTTLRADVSDWQVHMLTDLALVHVIANAAMLAATLDAGRRLERRLRRRSWQLLRKGRGRSWRRRMRSCRLPRCDSSLSLQGMDAHS